MFIYNYRHLKIILLINFITRAGEYKWDVNMSYLLLNIMILYDAHKDLLRVCIKYVYIIKQLNSH